jgi:TolA-binding protein
MARASAPKKVIEKLQDAGQEAIAKVVDTPAVGRVVGGATGMKERLDDLTLKVRGLEGIEKRLQDLEKKVEQLAKAQKPPAAKPSAASRSRSATKPAAKPAPAKKPGPVPGP